jgi:hypothetical protein
MSAAIDLITTPEPPPSEKEVLKQIVPGAEANPLWGLLANWHWMTVKYADVRQYRNVHWCGGKRPSLAVFASAAWQASGIAIEDHRVRKTDADGLANGAGQTTRCDLYFRIKDTDYLCGTKRIGLPLNEPIVKGMARIDAALADACEVTDNLPLRSHEIALGITFVTLQYRRHKAWSEQYLPAIRGAVVRWHEYLKQAAEEHFMAAAWFFPLHATESLQDARMFYPGCAVFIRDARASRVRNGEK